MDIERTMQFILESQAQAEIRAAKADARADRFEAHMDRFEVRMEKFEARMERMEKRSAREMAAIQKLLRQGMKAIAELTDAQKETDRVLKAFMKSSRNGGNGSGRKN
jgi:uncharacterized membrane protein YccC